MMAATTTVEVLTVEQVADVLHVSPRTITDWCRSDRLPAKKLPNGSWRILADELDRFLRMDNRRQ